MLQLVDPSATSGCHKAWRRGVMRLSIAASPFLLEASQLLSTGIKDRLSSMGAPVYRRESLARHDEPRLPHSALFPHLL
jgi:hypothetical protein